MSAKALSRRQFLRASAMVAAGAALAACQPQVVEVTKEVEVIKEVEVEVPVEQTVVVEETVVVPAEGVVTIRFTSWYGEGDIETWDKVNDAFEQNYPNIKIDYEPITWSQYWQKLNVGIAAGDPPDVAGQDFAYQYGGKGQLKEIGPWLEGQGIDVAQWFPGLIGQMTWPPDGGPLWGLPYRFTGSAFFINKTLFDEAGIPYPEKGWSWPGEYLSIAQQLTNPDNEQWGTSIPGGQLMVPFLATNGTARLTADTRHSNFLDEKVKEVYGFMADLICEYNVAPMPDATAGLGDLFVSGKIAMNPNAQWSIPVYRKITDFEWDVVWNPTNETAKIHATYGGADCLAVTALSKHPDEGFEFVNFACGTTEGQQIMSATGVPTLVAEAANPDFIKGQAEQGPASYQLIIDQAANAQGDSFGPGWHEWNGKSGQVLTELYNCRMGLEEALTQIDQEVEEIVTQAYADLGL